VPDYYMSLKNGVSLVHDPELAKFGEKCIRCDMEAEWYTRPEDGKTKIRWRVRGMCELRTAPQVKTKTPCVLSIWLRGKEGGERVEMRAFGRRETVTLAKEWKRFSFKGVIPPKLTARHSMHITFTFRPQNGTETGTFWADGIQLEAGETMTPFEN
jgi:hypothetical protein